MEYSGDAWDNKACLGYIIKSLKQLNYGKSEIEKIIATTYSQFDYVSVEEAIEIYNDSPY